MRASGGFTDWFGVLGGFTDMVMAAPLLRVSWLVELRPEER
jgi:hypothetical protein